MVINRDKGWDAEFESTDFGIPLEDGFTKEEVIPALEEDGAVVVLSEPDKDDNDWIGVLGHI